MLQKISSVFVVYRHKTLTGSPDPTHAIGTDKALHPFDMSNKMNNSTLYAVLHKRHKHHFLTLST